MKIDRVILSANNNEMYYPFWNIVSKVYKTKFGIEPVLIFLGTDEERLACDLSEEYGQVITYNLSVQGKLAWECTWALFYFTKLFPDDVCLIMGIDQIPLGTYFIRDLIEEFSDETYVMLTDDIYAKTEFKTWDEGGISPSAYHIAKGETFVKIYNFEDTFEDELLKLESMNLSTMWYKDTDDKKWGYDETYSSKILYENKNTFKIVGLKRGDDLISRRIDCYRDIEVNYNPISLKSNYYIECHSCRPYKKHKNWIDNLVHNIPDYTNN